MSNHSEDRLCQQVEEQIASVIERDVDPALLEHIAGCDRCRDLRHDASKALNVLHDAGNDYRHPEDFEAQLLLKFEAKETACAGAVPTSCGVEAREAQEAGVVLAEQQAPQPVLAEQQAPQPVVGAPAGDPEAESAPSEVAKPMPEASPRVEGADGGAAEPAPATSSEQAKTGGARAARGPREDRAAQAGERVGQALRGRAAKAVALGIVSMAALAAAAGLALYARQGPSDGSEAFADGASWSGRVAQVSVAGRDGASGLSVCEADGSSCEHAVNGAEVTGGKLLRTDARTRVHVELSDGTVIALDRATELTLGEQAGRVAKLRTGAIVAEVAHLEQGPGARIELPNGAIDVLGTKFNATVTEDRAAVEVARGAVRLTNRDGDAVVVRAGEEGTLMGSEAPVVMPSAALGEGMIWSEHSEVEEGAEDVAVRGLGELRARKPGSSGELDQAVRLTKHEVKVRIVGSIARTEIDETFGNDSGDVLEGIYRFPLPPDAQIERLALEVDGKMEEGAFVDKERAAAIWRGVIHAAAPKSPKPRDEIIWVPGPWRDPALLEWQRGGRFELRIYPIPARGSRRVVLAYTQSIPPSAGVRRYTYPLSYDPSGSTRVDQFDVDVQVRGHDKSFDVRSRGYSFDEAEREGAKTLTMHASAFVPSGDITLEYALSEDAREVTAWAFRPTRGGLSEPGKKDEGNDTGTRTTGPKGSLLLGGEEPTEGGASGDAYVAIALRPKLPRWSEGTSRDHVIVVDVSRSMVGERYSRAVQLAARVVREMDRRDRFAVLACDTTCRAMERELGAPGGAAAQRVGEFLRGVEPEGGSDMIEMVRQARRIADEADGKQELRIVYIGDGTPSVGPVRAPHVMLEVSRVLPAGSGMLNTVAVGADADTHALAAMARGGGGVMIPYVPGERTAAVAMRVLGASYGMALRNPTVELPEGMTEVHPKTLDNIPAGGESIVVARMRREQMAGTIKLRGKVGGETYEQSFPIELTVSAKKGNAFVPRLYAATKIADLEANQGESAKTELIVLSKRFAVASRYTSLLVLESPAMFKAFGVERTNAAVPFWTGDEESESAGSDGLTRFAEDDEAEGSLGAIGGSRGSGHGAPARKRSSGPKAADEYGGGGWAPPPTSMAEPSFDRRPPAKSAPPAPIAVDESWDGPPPRRMVPMRRVWDRKAQVTTDPSKMLEQVTATVAKAEAEANANPDSRTKLEALLGLYAVAGQVDRVADLATRWSKRDALDPGALVARADAAARQGDRARAIRILGGLADVRPGDADTQTWLATLSENMSDPFAACSHRIALADLRGEDASVVADAVRCARATSRTLLATTLLSDVTKDDVRAKVERELANAQPSSTALRGDVRIEATWDADVDLDVSLISKSGQRYCWLGDPKGRVTARDATAQRRESLAVFNAPRGEYLLEVTRADAGESDLPVRGMLTVKAAGATRTIPFVLSGPRTQAGTLKIYYTSHLEPVRGW